MRNPGTSRFRRSRLRQRENASFFQWQKSLHQLNRYFEKSQFMEYVQLLQKPFRMMSMNLLFGIARGLGIALGFTIFTTFVVWFLNWLGALDLPIIGDLIADLVEAVQNQLESRRF